MVVMAPRAADERGFALVAALLVMMVVTTLGFTIMQLAIQLGDQTARDRKTVVSAQAAQSGVAYYVSGLPTRTGAAICDPQTGQATPSSRYSFTIVAYDAADVPLACTDDDDVPAYVVIDSRGSTGSVARQVTRRIQTKVLLDPLYGGFDSAIFSNEDLTLFNSISVYENIANDAGIYTNGNFVSNNNVLLQGPVIAQGSATLSNSGSFAGGVWANGAISAINNVSMAQYATSSTSSISMFNAASLQGDARAGTTISAGVSAITGTRTQESPQGPPPPIDMPQLVWDATIQAAWESEGYSIHTYADCALAKAFIESGPTGSNLVRIVSTCSLAWENNSDISVMGNLAVITNGPISTSNNTTFTAIGGDWNMFMIVAYPSVGVPSCTTGSISFDNLTTLEGLTTFVYTPCSLTFGNNNTNGWQGQLLGGTVNLTNAMSMTFRPVTVPGAHVSGFAPVIAYTQELSAGPP